MHVDFIMYIFTIFIVSDPHIRDYVSRLSLGHVYSIELYSQDYAFDQGFCHVYSHFTLILTNYVYFINCILNV